MQIQNFQKQLLILAIFLVFPAGIFAQHNNQTLATKDGYKLMTADVDVYVKTLEFVIGQKIKPAEIQKLRAEAISGFNNNPANALNETKQVKSMIEQIYRITNPIKIAEGRILFLSELYKLAQSTPQKEWSSVLKIQNRYIKVLKYNPQTGLLLTDKDIEAFLNFIDFTRKLNGDALLSTTDKIEFRQALPEHYAELSTEQQALFALMPILWEIVGGQWNKLTQQQQKRAISQFKTQTNLAGKTQSITPTALPTTASRQPSLNKNLTAQQKILRKRMVYQMMSNMSRSQHLTTMNILENIGGSGDYWTFKPNF